MRNLKILTAILFVSFMAVLPASAQWPARNSRPWEKGAFETRQYRNLFVEMGYQPQAVEKKLQEVFDDVFRGPNKVYFEVGDSLGYISDIKNHDVRTEGMSYGMMIAVQMNQKDIFDRLWRWSKKYMQHQQGSREGYFAWSCKTDGTHNAEGAASDGELYFITSLLFASNLWGNDTGIDYKREARHIIDCAMSKDGTDGQQPLIHPEHKLITFTPDNMGSRFTDPSYHIPAFYEVWARWADDGRADFWREAAAKAREFLHKAINPETGLNPDMCNYDGTIMDNPWMRRGGSANFRYDSWRVPMNIALDYEWSCKDKEWQQKYAETFQNFLYKQGVDSFVDQYRVDGTLPEGNEILQAGGFRKLRHSIGLVATTAAASVMCTHEKKREFVKALWDMPHQPFEDGYFDAYYDGLLRLFAFMHLSGHYRIIFPDAMRELKAGNMSMTIDTGAGGRIVSLKYDGKEVISQSKAPESFGSTFWTSPQNVWNWPPVPEIDKYPYEITEDGPQQLTITSQVAPKLGMSVSKKFVADKKNGRIDVTYQIVNADNRPHEVAPWEVTRVPHGGLIFFEAPLEGFTPAGLMAFENAHGCAWTKPDVKQENRKVNADGKGWLAFLNDGLLLLKTFDDLKDGQPAPGEAEIQVYINRGKSYIELESQGAYVTLKPGESLSWTVGWTLKECQDKEPSKQLADKVKKLAKKNMPKSKRP